MRSALARRATAVVGGAAIAALAMLTASCASEEEKAPEETTTTTTEPSVIPTEKAPRIEPGPNPFSPTVHAPPAPTAVPGDN